jgi:hypothetical protein
MAFEAKDLSFSVHEGSIWGEKDYWNVICFCPKEYWIACECVPDYFFMDNLPALPDGYEELLFHEEALWCSKKPIDEIKSELISLGYTHNPAMERFLRENTGI